MVKRTPTDKLYLHLSKQDQPRPSSMRSFATMSDTWATRTRITITAPIGTAARDGALAAARGDDADGRAAALRLQPGAVVRVERGDGVVTVTVTSVADRVGALPGITVSATSTAALEPDSFISGGAPP